METTRGGHPRGGPARDRAPCHIQCATTKRLIYTQRHKTPPERYSHRRTINEHLYSCINGSQDVPLYTSPFSFTNTSTLPKMCSWVYSPHPAPRPTFVVREPQRGHPGNDGVGARGPATVQPRGEVRQSLRFTEPLVEQAQVCQQSCARGNAIHARNPAVWTTTGYRWRHHLRSSCFARGPYLIFP